MNSKKYSLHPCCPLQRDFLHFLQTSYLLFSQVYELYLDCQYRIFCNHCSIPSTLLAACFSNIAAKLNIWHILELEQSRVCSLIMNILSQISVKISIREIITWLYTSSAALSVHGLIRPYYWLYIPGFGKIVNKFYLTDGALFT